MSSGLTELRAKLGPILWQFAPTKRFDAEDFGRFLELLPQVAGGHRLRHVLDVRHASFMHPDFVVLARSFRAAITFTDSDDYPSFADITSDFIYARLMRAGASVDTGYPREALQAWAKRVQTWTQGGEPTDLPRVQGATTARIPRDVFIFMINGAKERAPAAARQLLACLGQNSRTS